MEDPFRILGQEFDVPPTFESASRSSFERLQVAIEHFLQLADTVPEAALSPDEIHIIEAAAEDLETGAERLDDGLVAVQYDSHAWYRIMEQLERVTLRLESAAGILQAAGERYSAAIGLEE